MAAKRGIELDHVIDVAATLADRDGLDRVTLARVAGALDVQSPSLYAHVEGLPGLRRQLALRAAATLEASLDEAMRGQTGADALRALAYAYRAFGETHPGLFAAIATTPPAEDDREVFDAFADPVTTIVAVLDEMGVPPQDAVAVVRTIRSAVHGFVALHLSGGFGLPGDVDASFDVLVDIVIAGILTRTEVA